MRRKRRVFYSISVPGKWWCGRKIGWVDSENLHEIKYWVASSSRTLLTANRAFRHVSGLPVGTRLTRWRYKHGERCALDFIKV